MSPVKYVMIVSVLVMIAIMTMTTAQDENEIFIGQEEFPFTKSITQNNNGDDDKAEVVDVNDVVGADHEENLAERDLRDEFAQTDHEETTSDDDADDDVDHEETVDDNDDDMEVVSDHEENLLIGDDDDNNPLASRFIALNAKAYSGRDDDDSDRYKGKKGGRQVGAAGRQATPSGHGGIPKVPVDNGMPKQPQAAPTFSQFNGTTPRENGNCIEAINQARTAAGVAPVTPDNTLVQLAAQHSEYQSATQRASHDGFWSYRFDAVPFNSSGVGEVVIAEDKLNAPNGNAKRAVDRWIASPEHKALLTRVDMGYAGCSVTEGQDGRFYATAIVVTK